jgi:DNA-binding MarR family transcriptional regulator
MSHQNLDRRFGFLLHDVSRLLRKQFDRRAQSLGLTRAQWAVIAHLFRNEGINQTALAELLEIEKITLARLLDRLEAADWLERRPDPGDRRANRLYLKEKAYPIVDRMRLLASEVQDLSLDGLDPQQREALIDMLLMIKRNLQAQDSPELPVEAPATLPAS